MIRQLSVGLIGLSLFNPIPKNQKQIKFCKGVNPHYVSTYDLLKNRITYNTNLEKQKLADELISKFQQQIIDKQKEYDNEMYARAKQAQMAMAAMKKKQKEYDSLWDEEGGEYDPEGVADNTEAQGELPEIPSETSETSSEES